MEFNHEAVNRKWSRISPKNADAFVNQIQNKLKNFKVRESDVVDIVHPKYLDWLQDHNTPFRTHLFYFLPSLYKALKRRLLLLLK